MEQKKPWLSKTFWFGVATALAPAIPGAAEFMAAHVAEIAMIWGVLAIALRFITKGKVSLLD